MYRHDNFNTMRHLLYNLFLISIILSSNYTFSKENDDMYFMSNDRVNKIKKKVTPASVILSKYRNGSTSINSSDVVEASLINKYRSKIDSKSFSKSSYSSTKSLKYQRDNLYLSKSFEKTILDVSIFMFGIRPYYYSMMD